MGEGSGGQSWADTLRDLAIARRTAPRHGGRTVRSVGDATRLRLEDRAWQGGPIRSTALVDVRFMALFALLWMTITAVVLLPLPNGHEPFEIDAVLVAAFFPLAGIAMLVYVLHGLRDYRRFGPLPLTLAPFPARPGRSVSGRINEVPAGIDLTDARVRLTLVRRWTRSKPMVERSLFDTTASIRTSSPPTGSALVFSVDVPEALPESTPAKEGESFVWSVTLESPAAKLSRRYEIPVLAASAPASASAEAAVRKAGAADLGTEDPGTAIPVSARQRTVARRLAIGGPLLCSALWFWTTLFGSSNDFRVTDILFLAFGVVPLLAIPRLLRRLDETMTIERPPRG